MHNSSHHEAQPAPPRVSISLAELTGAVALFEVLVESLLPHIRREMPLLSAPEARARLHAFRPRFEAVYASVMQEQLGAEIMPELVDKLLRPPARAYFAARRGMSPELGQRLMELSFEMGKTSV